MVEKKLYEIIKLEVEINQIYDKLIDLETMHLEDTSEFEGEVKALENILDREVNFIESLTKEEKYEMQVLLKKEGNNLIPDCSNCGYSTEIPKRIACRLDEIGESMASYHMKMISFVGEVPTEIRKILEEKAKLMEISKNIAAAELASIYLSFMDEDISKLQDDTTRTVLIHCKYLYIYSNVGAVERQLVKQGMKTDMSLYLMGDTMALSHHIPLALHRNIKYSLLKDKLNGILEAGADLCNREKYTGFREGFIISNLNSFRSCLLFLNEKDYNKIIDQIKK